MTRGAECHACAVPVLVPRVSRFRAESWEGKPLRLPTDRRASRPEGRNRKVRTGLRAGNERPGHGAPNPTRVSQDPFFIPDSEGRLAQAFEGTG
jgi:hypothetical protein